MKTQPALFTWPEKLDRERIPPTMRIGKDLRLLEDDHIADIARENVVNDFRLSDTSITLVLKGAMTFVIDGVSYPVKAPFMTVILPSRIRRLIHQSSELMSKVILLSPAFTDEMLKGSGNKVMMLKRYFRTPVVELQPWQANLVLSYLDMLKMELANVNNPGRYDAVKFLMTALLTGHFRSVPMQHLPGQAARREQLPDRKQDHGKTKWGVSQRKVRITDAFFNLLDRYGREQRDVAFYAQKLGINRRYLHHCVKEITHHSVLDWIDELVVSDLKHELRTTAHSLQAISRQFYFTGPDAMRLYFKRVTGLTPSQYRKQQHTNPDSEPAETLPEPNPYPDNFPLIPQGGKTT